LQRLCGDTQQLAAAWKPVLVSNATAWRKLKLPVDDELLLRAEQRLEDLTAAATKRTIDEVTMMYTTGFRIQVHCCLASVLIFSHALMRFWSFFIYQLAVTLSLTAYWCWCQHQLFAFLQYF